MLLPHEVFDQEFAPQQATGVVRDLSQPLLPGQLPLPRCFFARGAALAARFTLRNFVRTGLGLAGARRAPQTGLGVASCLVGAIANRRVPPGTGLTRLIRLAPGARLARRGLCALWLAGFALPALPLLA